MLLRPHVVRVPVVTAGITPIIYKENTGSISAGNSTGNLVLADTGSESGYVNRYALLVCAASGANSGVTANGATMTLLLRAGSGSQCIEFWGKAGIGSGALTFVVTQGSVGNNNKMWGAALRNTEQTSTVDNTANSLPTSLTPPTSQTLNLSASLSDFLCIDGVMFGGPSAYAISPDAAQTQRMNVALAFPSYTAGVSTRLSLASPTATPFLWNLNTGSGGGGGIMAAIALKGV